MSAPERHFLDTNLLIRFLTEDNFEQSQLAAAYMARVKAGEVVGVIADSVLFETVFVLSGRVYGVSRPEIVSVLSGLIAAEGIVTIGVIDFNAVFRLYLEFPKLSIADCAHAWLAGQHGGGSIVTFDSGFDDLEDVTRVDLHKFLKS